MKSFLILFSFLFVLQASAQKKKLESIRITQSPKIDGVLDEEYWTSAPAATDFTMRDPNPGIPSGQKAEIRIVYDNIALYVGAKLADVNKDSILRELSKRDNEGNTDLFGLFLDTYNDDQNAFGFFVTASGVQIDAKYSPNGQDFNWNAVWESEVKITDNGWYVEMKIPYSAIRFSNVPEQTWGVNFLRKIRRTREVSFWNEVNPAVNGLINQSGDLAGIKDIKAPLRLSLTPYVSAYMENYPYNTAGKSNNSYSLNGGLDVKLGISEGFTLDMTLVPDFGQVQSDNRVLNLSPFEVRYDENRPFFTEGTELFNRGNLFYTRRIGAAPMGYYDILYNYSEKDIIENPAVTQLLNATKISGRTKNNLGIGFFNATSAEMQARVRMPDGSEERIVTQPLTNYNVFVLDQALKNNSNINFINTNVTREGSVYDANVTGGGFRLVNKSNTYSLGGGGAVSQKYFPGEEADLGYAYHANFGKISGNFNWNIGGSVEDDKYDPNDLGILFNNNTVEASANLSYNIFKPFWKVNNLYTNLGASYGRIYNPDVFWNLGFYGEAVTTYTKSFLSNGLWFGLEPVITYDYFEPRVQGRFYTYPVNYTLGYWFSSDYRKKFALDFRSRFRDFDDGDRNDLAFGLSPRYRVNNKLSFIYDFDRTVQQGDVGWVYNYNDMVVFGRRNVQTIFNVLNVAYTFTNRMSLTLRGRHYWSKVRYTDYYILENDGLLAQTEFLSPDRNFNAFNIDMVYTWQFAPGSEISFVWKNAILNDEPIVENLYFENVRRTVASPQTNSFSVKILYFLDYSMLKRKA